ncbi:MAG: hypothetical protein COV08_01940 [Candidatus Vogelbacteria bacterium CG10_big_fil_rev_8_21_14_0_10_49_38]|uniref:Glycosyltransferase 2-like domain-containing protein n=1 Tax=Candidatus Vogelbacteria bacterium CG10_big_fil_rev_8_21_14_0_10_49_38 TaxID=1975043 RepID=A0A2H0RJR0_9BACT|nr:MAG: hypothetical protein BK006_01960 [bacterium CG10_49_38]PIR46015.1 MAG: hypothetical protein COV08_01940 [Candidatus Vogelbacteria bacterium CG10_big_fil_rev_8_21_14_0_10_49_38]
MSCQFSVIVPARNSEATLEACLRSILAQSVRDFELIAVDNNSNDRTKEVVENLVAEDSRVRYLFEPKIGRGAARNAGVRVARGAIILMTDSDCVVSPNWLVELTQPIIEAGEKIVMGFEEPLADNFWSRQTQLADQEFLDRHTDGRYARCLDTKNIAFGRSVFVSASFDPTLENFEDFDFYLQIRSLFKIRLLSEIRVTHRHPDSFFRVLKINFNRAFWTARIYDKHKNSLTSDKVIAMTRFLARKIEVGDFVSFLWQTKGEEMGTIFFRLIVAFAWSVGLLRGKFS